MIVDNKKEVVKSAKRVATKMKLVKDDPWLDPYANTIKERYQRFREWKEQITEKQNSLYDFAGLHKKLGFHFDIKDSSWTYREWAPKAKALYLFGDFNNWDRKSHPLKRTKDGYWEVTINSSLKHKDLIKVVIETESATTDRIPLLINRVVQNQETKDFSGQLWYPDKEYKWQSKRLKKSAKEKPLLIYEAHTGMALEEERVGTYVEFRDQVLPRIKQQGYNAIQLMAIQEHPYYGSFGYHVSNFFAPSSRFGTPDDLKSLIDKAHKMGIRVIMDLVHSHAVKNINEGINKFDGTQHQFFHEGEKGVHPAWDSMLFNYGKEEVIQFLLSNIRYWMEEYQLDGFRFDGVSSMLYWHHGNVSFDNYSKYFDEGVDIQAVTYLQLANELIHTINPDAVSIAEDVSGMPGLCRPIEEGGLGFDYRLAMGIPDNWIKHLKEKRDEEWSPSFIWGFLTNRRNNEKTIAYCESHDQALVGDKTIAFWLMDQEMYWHMSESDENDIIHRGISLHKMIRLATIALGGEAYLNFMGNEFGHPEWVDFPREENGWSYKYCRRQWSLVDNQNLKYKYLNNFDKILIALAVKEGYLNKKLVQLNVDEKNQTLVFSKGKLIFVFNFHPQNSIPDYRFFTGIKKEKKYKIVLNSDSKEFGGHHRVDDTMVYQSDENGILSIYNTNRTALVFRQVGR